MDERIARLAATVLESRKYAHISPDLVARLTVEELEKGRKAKDVVKAVRNKLHQVGGAYQTAAPNYDSWLTELRLAGTRDALKQACWMLMDKHASTRERLPILQDFYASLFALLPPIHSVLDAACGLNPLALPWMPLAPGAKYLACDMYTDMIAFINGFFEIVEVNGRAEVCDVAAAPPNQEVDLALVMKAIPCLEQIEKQAGERLLDGLNARYLAVSFPAKSLGGRRKGMIENYAARFGELLAGRDLAVLDRLEFETELLFVVKRG